MGSISQQQVQEISNVPFEIKVATEWWVQQMNKEQLTEEQVNMFRENLLNLLHNKYQGHWYPDVPYRGNGFRSLLCDHRSLDKILIEAARRSYIGNLSKRFRDCYLIMWIDPGQVEVKYFSSHKGSEPIVIYSVLEDGRSPKTSDESGGEIEVSDDNGGDEGSGYDSHGSQRSTKYLDYLDSSGSESTSPVSSSFVNYLECKSFVNSGSDLIWQNQRVGYFLE
eukprot:TRINITY_DN2301_c0_g1_i1.p1 TRINITY_DN2301_c0_g1~~TRINITY_DN2301_c0_g1_i1.p1  ORF type:complete len:259 (-),score=51.47 TRINITY_DN2301_c0_g1_i1:10-678(-)